MDVAIPSAGITHLDVCAGAGGRGRGLRLAFGSRVRTICYVERESYAASVIVARMEGEALDRAPVWDSVETFDGKSWRGLVDIFSAGFPCQPWSLAGQQKGQADERWIWADIARIIAESLPQVVWLENVPGLLVRGGIDRVLEDLTALGYTLERPLLLAASDVGGSHERERLFILAYREGTKLGGLGDVAQPESGGLGELRESSGSARQPNRSHKELGNASRDNERRDLNGEDRERIQTGGSSGLVGDFENDLGRRRELGAEKGTRKRRIGRRRSPEPSRDVAKAESDGLAGDRETGPLEDSPTGSGSGDAGFLSGGSERSSIAMANAGHGQFSEPRRREEGRDGSRSASPEHVADPSEPGLQGRERSGASGGRDGSLALGSTSELCEVPLFPPRPGDLQLWERILESSPSLEPAVCGMADELAYRVDRLRLCGNGVVPLVVAVAFYFLASRAEILE